MTSRVARLYALGGSLLALSLGWLGLAAQPWQAAEPEPQPPALASLERRLGEDAALLAELAAARQQASPTVRVVTLPPLTTTRTS